jgi:hypothetical protein
MWGLFKKNGLWFESMNLAFSYKIIVTNLTLLKKGLNMEFLPIIPRIINVSEKNLAGWLP